MKYLLITLLLISCGKQNHTLEVEVPKEMPTIEVDAPENIQVEVEDSEHLMGFDYPAVLKWCKGKIDHKIVECRKLNLGQVCDDMELDKEYLTNECYYDLDLSVLNSFGGKK